MALYEDVFKRKEKKYVVDNRQRANIEALLAENMAESEYGETRVNSLYFDTPQFELIEHSLDKPAYKEKLRLRVYGKPSPDALAFVEIKKKFKGTVYKRRVPMTLSAAETYLGGMPYEDACSLYPMKDAATHAQSLSERSMQISREIDFMMGRHAALAPSMLVTCKRVAYASSGGMLRITFDSELCSVRGAASIYDDEGAKPIISPEDSVMEIKNLGPLPLWLVKKLDEIEARPQPFSKYGTAYMNERKVCRA